MPKVSEQHKTARRQQIIDAAYRCFARNGFHQTSMRDIYEEAQLSAGAIYNYFDSKGQIIEDSINFDYERSQAIFEIAKKSNEPLEALSNLLEFFFKGLEEASVLGAGRVNVQAWGEALRNPGLLKTIRYAFDSYKADLAEIVLMGQQKGSINSIVDPNAVAQTILSLYLGLELQKTWNPEVNVADYLAAVKTMLEGNFRL